MLFFEYFIWHYTTAINNLFTIARNYLIATWFRFGIVFHFRTLFYPWRRQTVTDEQESGILLSIGMKIIGAFVDLYFRLIAALVRFSVILAGLFCCGLIVLFFGSVFVLWILWPLIFLAMIAKGIVFILWR